MSSEEAENTGQVEGRYLSFSLGSQEYAIPLLCVKEVIAMPDFTPIPFTPAHYLGIMNLRGQVISIIDLRKKMNIKPLENSELAVIICDLTPLCLGVLVDSINSVLSPNAADISQKPEFQGNKGTDYITNIYRKDKKLVLFLDIAKALDIEDQRAIAKAGKAAA